MDRGTELVEFARLRDSCPVSSIGPRGHLLVRYADVLAVLRDNDGYAALADPAIPRAAQRQWALDPAEHRRRRERLFTAERVDAASTHVASTSRALVEGATGRERCEVVAEVLRPLARSVIAEQLGIAEDDRAMIFELVDRMGAAEMGDAIQLPAVERQRRWRAGAEPLERWVIAQRASRQQQPTREPDGIDLLLRPDELSDRELPDVELLAYVYLLCRSGEGPLVRLLGNVVHHLADDAGALGLIHEDPSLAPALVETVLRDDPPIQYLIRLPVTDTTLHEVVIPAGDRVVMSVASANEDAARHSPARLGERPKHVGFGRGEHFCPAAALGRRVAAQLATDLATMVREIRFDPAADLAALHAPPVWTPVSLPATLVPRRER